MAFSLMPMKRVPDDRLSAAPERLPADQARAERLGAWIAGQPRLMDLWTIFVILGIIAFALIIFGRGRR